MTLSFNFVIVNITFMYVYISYVKLFKCTAIDMKFHLFCLCCKSDIKVRIAKRGIKKITKRHCLVLTSL